MFEYRDDERCAQCGGACCRVYAPNVLEQVVPDMSLADYAAMLHPEAGAYGVEPLFDPVAVYERCDAKALDALEQSGLDPYACQYLGPDGCLIPWDRRPSLCKEFRCEDWEDEDRPDWQAHAACM